MKAQCWLTFQLLTLPSTTDTGSRWGEEKKKTNRSSLNIVNIGYPYLLITTNSNQLIMF